MRLSKRALALGMGLVLAAFGSARAQTTLRMVWYSDGNEGAVMSDLLHRFEGKNPDIRVVLDQVPFQAINQNLPVQVAAGQGPDMARVVDLGGVAPYLLDLRPLLKDPATWEKDYAPFLPWLRAPGNTTALPGFMTQLTMTGPFVNKTLFEQAGMAMPGDGASWDDWARAVKAVADKTKTPYPLAMDRSGHRFLSLAISEGAKLFDADGKPELTDEGFRRAAQMIVDWHKSGVMSKDLWGSVSGAAYRGANEEFANGQVVMYVSGSWQIAQFDKTIGDAFDWVAVPTPCGPANCSPMPGGAALVAFKETRHPAEVARVMEFLASAPVMKEFYDRALFLPGNVAVTGLDYPSASPRARAALQVFAGEVKQVSPIAYRMQGYLQSRVVFNATISRLGQAVSGEMSLDEALRRINDDVTQQIAERERK